MDEPLLRIEGLTRLGFGPFALELRSGECVAMTGRSGSGKSLLLRMIADLDPHEGEAWCGGERRSAMPAPEWRRQIVYCAAQPGWWGDRVAEHFLDLSTARALLYRLALPADILDGTVDRLSSGERQRLSLLRALVQHPRVLLLDEPTSALDTESCHAVEALLRERLAAGTGILLATHDPRQAERLAGRRFRMADRRLAAA